MKQRIKLKMIVILIVLINITNISLAQNYKVGIKLAPIHSQLNIDNGTALTPNYTGTRNIKCQNDSLFLQIQAEKSSSTSPVIYRAAFCFGQYRSISGYEEISTNETSQSVLSYNTTYARNYLGLTFGVANKYIFEPFAFQLGVEMPFYFLPEGILNSDERIKYSETNWQESVGVATFSNSLILGLGGFANISTTFFKKISLGFDISYRIQYSNELINWDATTLIYDENSTPISHENSVTQKIRNNNLTTTKIFPSLIISYCF